MSRDNPNANNKISRRRYAGKTSQERRDERYRLLLAAGIEVIGTRGYRAASIKSICVQAGLTERYFYESFVNREALLYAIYEHLNEVMRARTLEALIGVPSEPVTLARAGAEAYFRVLRDDPRIARILLFEAVNVSGAFADANHAAEARFVELIRSMVPNAIGDSRLPSERETLVITGLVGAGIKIAKRWVLDDYRQPLETVVESIVLIYEAIIHHLLDSRRPRDDL